MKERVQSCAISKDVNGSFGDLFEPQDFQMTLGMQYAAVQYHSLAKDYLSEVPKAVFGGPPTHHS